MLFYFFITLIDISKGSSLMNITDRKDKYGCKTFTDQDIFWLKESSDKNPRGVH